MPIEEIKIGYHQLMPHVARDNGSEWARGVVYGVTISMSELCAIVAWEEALPKERKMALLSELKADPSCGLVYATAIPKGSPGFCFKLAEYILGSAMVFVESELDVSDFEVEDSEELPGAHCELAVDLRWRRHLISFQDSYQARGWGYVPKYTPQNVLTNSSCSRRPPVCVALPALTVRRL